MAEDVLFDFLHMEIVNLMYDSSATNDEQVTDIVAIRTAVRIETNCYTDFGPNRYIPVMLNYAGDAGNAGRA